MAPGYSSLAKRMQEEENGVPIAKVDATVEKELAEKFGSQCVVVAIDAKQIDHSWRVHSHDPFCCNRGTKYLLSKSIFA